MNRFATFVSALSICSLSLTVSVSAGDWPWWRGPTRNGIAEPGQNPPTSFNATENCRWSVPLPGRAHGSPCVFGDRLFLTAADEELQVQLVLCFDRKTGKRLWETPVHRGGFTQKMNKKGSWASGSPACDGERVFISFINGDAVYTTALDLEGKQVWQTKITNYTIHQSYGSSPAIYENLVLVSADNKGGGALAGLDRKTGEVVWRVERDKKANYPSPIILEAAGKTQLFLTGTDKVTSLDPLTGTLNWEIDGATTECVTSTVTDGKHIYSSGGYPKNHVAAIAADGSGKIAWENTTRVYVPSMIVREGYLYAVMDAGVAVCWKSDTGEEMWKERLGGTFSASPTMVGDRFYAGNEAGELFVFEATPKGMKILAKNALGDEIFAMPVICDSEIFQRVAFYDGDKRTEKLFCYSTTTP